MANIRTLQRLSATKLTAGFSCWKRLASSEKGYPSTKLQQAFEHFQREDGVPVYLKKGFPDRVLYISTIVGVVIGAACSYYYLLSKAFPSKKK